MSRSSDAVRYLETLPQMLSVLHKVTPETEKYGFHLHEPLEVVVALSDNLACRYVGGVCPLPAPCVLLLDSMTMHYIFRRAAGPADRYVVYFRPECAAGLSLPTLHLLSCFYLRTGLGPVVLPLTDTELDELLPLLERLQAGLAVSPHGDSAAALLQTTECRLLLGQLLVFLNRLSLRCGVEKPFPTDPGLLEAAFAVRDYIRDHYAEPLSAGVLAQQAYLGKTRLYEVFCQVFGVTVGEYLTRYRMTRAKDLLLNSDDSIQLIAEKVGYASASTFTRAFHTRTGHSPAQYRRRQGE